MGQEDADPSLSAIPDHQLKEWYVRSSRREQNDLLSRMTFQQLARCFPWEVLDPMEPKLPENAEVGVNLVDLAKEITKVNELNGWTINLEDKQEMGLKFALCASEAAEACEEYAVGQFGENGKPVPTAEWVKRMQVEFADVAIRVLHLMDKMGLNPQEAYCAASGHLRVGAHSAPRVMYYLQEELFFHAVMKHVVMPSFRLFERSRKPSEDDAAVMTKIFGQLLVDCERLSDSIDPGNRLWGIVTAKVEKNRQRGYKHGNKAF